MVVVGGRRSQLIAALVPLAARSTLVASVAYTFGPVEIGRLGYQKAHSYGNDPQELDCDL